MASQAARISSAFLPAGIATSLSSPSPHQKQELSFCRSAFCGAATHPSSSSSFHVSMFSQIFLKTKPSVIRRIAGGHCLCVAASSTRQFGAAAAASAVADSSILSSSGSVDEEQSSSAGELPKKQDVESRKKSGPKYLIGKSEEDLEKLCMALGERKYRGRQIHQLVYKAKAKNIDDFQHIPKLLREALTNDGWQVGRSPLHHIARSLDGTVKVLLKLEDNRLVETVGIPVFGKPGKLERLTACVSSQVGCALKCSFCATGKGGFARNLKPHEIVEQVLVIEEMFQARVSNVVFMGMGEPLMNLPALLPAVRTLNQDVAIGQRMMTISTVGVPNTIARLASHKLQSNLAISRNDLSGFLYFDMPRDDLVTFYCWQFISLHAPNQQLRTQIVPSAKAYPLEALLTDCRNYFLETGRRVSIEYTLLSGINDKPEHAEELARLLHHWKLGNHVNVIAYNPIADSEFRRPNNAQVKAFVDALNKKGVTASIRRTRGLDANAACGQLRNDFQKFAMKDSEVPTKAMDLSLES